MRRRLAPKRARRARADRPPTGTVTGIRPKPEPKGTQERDGQDFTEGPRAARVQVQDTQLQPLQAVRSPARVSAEVRPLPDLRTRDPARGHDPRHDEVELVAPCR